MQIIQESMKNVHQFFLNDLDSRSKYLINRFEKEVHKLNMQVGESEEDFLKTLEKNEKQFKDTIQPLSKDIESFVSRVEQLLPKEK
jgi:DNA relaxase NicK